LAISIDKGASKKLFQGLEKMNEVIEKRKLRDIQQLAKQEKFGDICAIKNKKMAKGCIIQSTYEFQLTQFVDNSQVTKELCEGLDP